MDALSFKSTTSFSLQHPPFAGRAVSMHFSVGFFAQNSVFCSVLLMFLCFIRAASIRGSCRLLLGPVCSCKSGHCMEQAAPHRQLIRALRVMKQMKISHFAVVA